MKIEAVKMHRVVEWGRIHNAPVLWSTELGVQPLCIRPRLAIDRKCGLESRIEQVLGPELNHEDTVGGAGLWRIDDERARHCAFRVRPAFDARPGSGRPREVAARLAGGETYLFRLARGKLHRIVGVSRGLVQAVNEDSCGQTIR